MGSRPRSCRYRDTGKTQSLKWTVSEFVTIFGQSVVERKLAKEGRSKHDLGRDAFIECVQEWNKQYGGRILHQIDRIGAIVNKSQSYFTLDPQRLADCEFSWCSH